MERRQEDVSVQPRYSSLIVFCLVTAHHPNAQLEAVGFLEMLISNQATALSLGVRPQLGFLRCIYHPPALSFAPSQLLPSNEYTAAL